MLLISETSRYLETMLREGDMRGQRGKEGSIKYY